MATFTTENLNSLYSCGFIHKIFMETFIKDQMIRKLGEKSKEKYN